MQLLHAHSDSLHSTALFSAMLGVDIECQDVQDDTSHGPFGTTRSKQIQAGRSEGQTVKPLSCRVYTSTPECSCQRTSLVRSWNTVTTEVLLLHDRYIALAVVYMLICALQRWCYGQVKLFPPLHGIFSTLHGSTAQLQGGYALISGMLQGWHLQYSWTLDMTQKDARCGVCPPQESRIHLHNMFA